MMAGYGMVQDQNLEKQIEKQMGCMAGFLQIFDRHQILAGKKYSTRRLPFSKVVDSGTGSETSAASSPAVSRELGKPQSPMMKRTPSPSPVLESVPPKSPVLVSVPPKSPLPLPISPWKFSKEAPRLSLDSRATVDAKGGLHPREIRTNSSPSSAGVNGGEDQQRRSTSVIARLMGLEPLPESNSNPLESPKKAELRRSASESRVSRDLFHFQQRPVDSVDEMAKTIIQEKTDHSFLYTKSWHPRPAATTAFDRRIVKAAPPQYRRSYFDTADVFPEASNKQDLHILGDIEKRLKMRGIEEPSRDLETLKQILEALQLKGLLHSNVRRPVEQRNFVYDNQGLWYEDDSPNVVMRHSVPKSPVNRRVAPESPPSRYGARRSPNRERPPGVADRNIRSPTRSGNGNINARSPRGSSNLIIKPKPLNVETKRSSTEHRKASPPPAAHSPKLSSRRNSWSHDPTAANRSPTRRRRSTDEKISAVAGTEDESSSMSGSTISTSSQTDTERPKMGETRDGKTLLERCDKLLSSIAEMNAAAEMQPSPVSVLDSSFYKDESSSPSPLPSPVMKRSIDFKDNEAECEDSASDLEEETWSSILRSDEDSADKDLVYIAEILMSSRYLPEDSDVFSLLERQHYLKGCNSTKVSRMQRKLIFDVVVEILNRNKALPPWKAFSWADSGAIKSSVRIIRSEFLRIRERDSSSDLVEVIGGVLKKDMAGDAVSGWGDCPPVELSEAVLDIERLIFKDLIGETIRDLAAFAGKSGGASMAPRRKLIF